MPVVWCTHGGFWITQDVRLCRTRKHHVSVKCLCETRTAASILISEGYVVHFLENCTQTNHAFATWLPQTDRRKRSILFRGIPSGRRSCWRVSKESAWGGRYEPKLNIQTQLKSRHQKYSFEPNTWYYTKSKHGSFGSFQEWFPDPQKWCFLSCC